MVLIAGDGVQASGKIANRVAAPPPPPPPPPVQRPVDAARAETAKAAAPATAAPAADRQSLTQTAANGRPVEAGHAMRTLDQQNGGNRLATNEQVGRASYKPAFMTGTALASATLATTRLPTRAVIDDSHEKDGVTTTTKGSVTSTTSHEGNTTTSLTDKTVTKSGDGIWSVTKTTTDQTVNTLFDANGRPVKAGSGAPTSEVERKVESSVGVKVDKDSASATVSVSGEKNGVKGSYTTTTKVDENGLSQSKSVEVGPGKASATGGLKIDENGNVQVSGTGGLNLGPVGAQVKGEHTTGPNGTKDSTTTSFSLKTPDGKPVSASVDYKMTDSQQLSINSDGSTTYKLTGETKLTLAGGVDAKRISVDASWFSGQRTVHNVTVPKGVDPKTIDPTKPESWPEGTRVLIKSEDFNGSTMGVAYANFGVEAGAETRDGTSIVMEKKSGDQLSVATGPTSGFTTSGKLKVDIGAGFGVELGGENKVDFAFYKTFDIDLKAPGGAQTFSDVFLAREAPKANADGVSNLMDTTYGDWNYTGGAKVNTPFGSFGPEHKEGSKSIWKTYADGRVEYSRTYDANGDGKGELTKTATSTDGKTWSNESYTLTLEVTTEEHSQLHNAKQMTANDNLKVGDKIEIKLTAQEVEALRQKHQSFNALQPESAEVKGRMNDSFADYLARQNGIDGILPTLFSLKHANKVGDYTSPMPKVDLDHPLPGTVTIIPKS